MLLQPDIDPIALSIGPLFGYGPINLYWYGITYIIGFLGAYLIGTYQARKSNSGWNQTEVNDLVFYCALGGMIGGRIGYMVFYNFNVLIADPMQMIRFWEGGMSFHGGLLGSMVSLAMFSKVYNKNYFDVFDFGSPMVPLGLLSARIGNFIGGELWGRATDLPWGMVFRNAEAGGIARHPSQLYQAFLEGFVLFVVMIWYTSKPKPRMGTLGLFLICYGSFRFIVEFVRQPDVGLGFIAFGWLTMGQLLSLPMIIGGVVFMSLGYRLYPVARNER